MGSSQWYMAGGRETATAAETRDTQAGHREESFCHEDRQAVEQVVQSESFSRRD